MDKVSIVLPIYNVESYLETCVRSVQDQTYKNIEIILVDDGAKDNSGKICDQLALKDNRIKVLHKENGGLSSARNAGYSIATGKYLMYIDSDDVIKADVVQKCVETIQRDQSDIVIYGYEKIDEKGNVLEVCTWGDKLLNHDTMVEYLYTAITEMSFGYAWNKLYRKSVIDQSELLADSKVIDREDLVYNLELLKYVDKISYIDYVGYQYLQRSTSLLHNGNLARLKGIDYFVMTMNNINVGNEEINNKLFNMNVLHYLADCIIKNIIWNTELKGKEKRTLMEKILKDCPFTERLYQDVDNPTHLQKLYKSIKSGKAWYFYTYVKLGDVKRKVLG
ncbi:MAG: glycosyltransferase family 2 protein [Eubacterium sp.]|nr:glycosyltransferase family 2 protein [Eubacterium sp.]